MSEKQTKNEIIELIRLIDSNKSKMFRPYDVLYGWSSLVLVIVMLYIFVEPIIIFNTPSMTDKGVLVLSFVAVIVALMSLVIPFARQSIVEKNFKRALGFREFRENDKLLLKALIKIKAKNPEFSLEQIYDLNKSMFTEKKLLEILYE